jgi:energy-coupling factor transport system permease protein
VDILRSLPIGLYLEQPITWLHRIDPRIKLIALLTILISPIQANDLWRITIFLLLIIITFASKIPIRVWKQQMGILLLLAFMTLAIASISPDGLNVNIQPRRPIPAFTQTPESLTSPSTPPLPQPTTYRYVLWKAGNITITRKSFDLGLRVCTLIFTYLYAPTLFLLVTAPEEITAAIAALFSPLQILKIPITEIVLTLTLALRFVPLVLEEVQNLARAIRTRSINWKKLGFKRTSQIWLVLAERLIDNLFIRAEQTASAMQVRGFTSPNTHLVKWNQLTMRPVDLFILASICLLWGMRIWFGGDV